MIILTDKNIEQLLKAVSDNALQKNSFGAAKNCLNSRSFLEKKYEERLGVYFQLKDKPAYSIRVESKSGGNDAENGDAKFELHYYSRHEILSKTSKESGNPLSDLEALFTEAYCRGSEYVGNLLKKAGLKWTSGWKDKQTYEENIVIAGQQANIRVDLREVPDDVKCPKRWYLEISARVFPEFKPLEKKQAQNSSQYFGAPFFRPAAAKP